MYLLKLLLREEGGASLAPPSLIMSYALTTLLLGKWWRALYNVGVITLDIGEYTSRKSGNSKPETLSKWNVCCFIPDLLFNCSNQRLLICSWSSIDGIKRCII